MDNVIHVDFGNKAKEEDLHKSALEYYLDELRTLGLDEDDVLEVADAIVSFDAYLAADDIVQKFADNWLNNPRY
jgi:hypothetical protein